MHIYILGICGTFMGSLAVLAKQAGFKVSGCDANVYPPMSTQLEKAGIKLDSGFNPDFLSDKPDLIVIGNAMSRGNPMVEYVLNHNLPYTSGPQFLHDHVLKDKWVLAVSGTHGKTTTSSMLAWILEYAGFNPGFLIGGVVKDFEFSARLSDSSFFVVEADEYDTAFFDKRSKFVHYQPKTLVINNVEFDHADIFEDLSAIKKQFHHVVRLVPEIGQVVFNAQDSNVADILSQGLWSESVSFGEQGAWQAHLLEADGSAFEVSFDGMCAEVNWSLTGLHNVNNALAAMAAAKHVGVQIADAAKALSIYQGVKRRMEHIGNVAQIDVYDDFAHHPTAIKTTLEGIKASAKGRVVAVIEPRSNTMRMGVHKDKLADCVTDADKCFWLIAADSDWSLPESAGITCTQVEQLLAEVTAELQSGDQVVLMSNGGFSGFGERLLSTLRERV